MKKLKERARKKLALLVCVILLFCSVGYAGVGVSATEDVASDTDGTSTNVEPIEAETEGNVTQEVYEKTYTGQGYEVTFKIDNKWESGYNATVIIKNTGEDAIENWCVSFPLEQEISNIWNANIKESYDDFYVVKNAGWNQDIPAGGNVSFGMTVYEAFTEFPEYYTMIGKELKLSDEDYSIDYVITEDWGEGYKAEVTITNNKSDALEDWRLSFDYGDNIITQIWNAKILANIDGRIEISCESYNQNISSGGSVTFGFLVEPGCSAWDVSSISLFEYNDDYSSEHYLSLMGIENPEKDELGLIMASIDEYERYEIYVSTDGLEFQFLDETEKDIYTMSLSGEYTYKEFYVYGYMEDGTKVKSNYFSVEATEEGFVAVLPDTDGDGLEDAFEYICGSDIHLVDSDGDTLDDYYEVVVSGTDPTMADTDEDGIMDPDEDNDQDGLTINEEKNWGTNPLEADVDEDDILDGDEVLKYGTDPYVPDTDEDGLLDGDEIVLCTEPLNPDTDGDGILDGDEKFQQTYVHTVENDCAIKEVKVTMEATGNVNKTTTVESVMNRDVMCTGVVGLIGEPFNIETTSEFDKATITYVIDTDSLGETKLSDLMFLWYDEENHQFLELETYYDEEASSVSIETTHFSRYMIVNRYDWFDAWTKEISYNPGLDVSGPAVYQYNTVLVIDCSSSMDKVDKITYKNVGNAVDAKYPKTCGRIEAGTNFIRTMSGNDRVAIVNFDKRAHLAAGLTSDKEVLRKALQSVYNYDYTEYSSGLIKAVEQFDVSEKENSTVRNRIIFMSDGQGTVSEDILLDLKEERIEIYTVGFGENSGDRSLQHMAEVTGGEFFKAYTAEELIDIYKEIGISPDFDTTDKDEDGLYDVIEMAGIRLENGSIVYTDPTLPDSDGDGLLDGEEINPEVMIKDIADVIGKLFPDMYEKLQDANKYYFVMNSDANLVDSDGDGLLDNQRIYYNDTVMVPIDPDLLVMNGPDGVWIEQSKLAMGISDTGIVATEYNYSYKDDNTTMHDKAKDADYYVNFLLKHSVVVTMGEKVINVVTDFLKLGAEYDTEVGIDFLDFKEDTLGVAYHSSVGNWQRAFGYNDVYDEIFEYSTDMRRSKHKFQYNGKEYILWLWKGDYWNLQSGAEMGLYVYDRTVKEEKHYDVVDFEVPMTMSLYNRTPSGVDNVFCWVPSENQWWVTGFNGNYTEPNPDNMVTISSIDLSSNKEMYDAAKESFEERLYTNVIYDDLNYTIWVVWDMEEYE